MPDSGVTRLTRALQHRNYRLFFGGQSVSLVGTWITRVATSWLVYRLTGSELLLGIVGFVGQIPTLLLTPFAGVLVDRMDGRRLLLITQVLSLLQSAVLAALTLADVITVSQILVLQLFQGVINAVDMPARQAFVVHMVEDRQDLPNAIALNSSMVNGSRIVGPSIGGVLIALFGEGWCFAVDAASYVAVVASLVAMRLASRVTRKHDTHVLEELRTGWRYVTRSVPIRTVLILLAVVGTAGMPYTVLMPAIAAQELRGGPNTLGLLMTATGVGAFTASMYLALRQSVVGLGRVITIGTVAFGGGLVAFSLSRTLWPAMAMLVIVGFGFIAQLASSNTILQTIVEERFRGRVMAFYAMCILGTVPVGSLFAGVIADRIGAVATVRLGGIICLASAAWFGYSLPTFRALVRPIYIERGIITVPDVDTGGKAL
jgi:MFS family permease